MDAENLITLTVEGTDSEAGHVRADELCDSLNHLLTTLNGIDRLVGGTGSPTLYYRIVNVSHASPLRLTLEPIIRRSFPKPKADHIARRHHRFFQELEAISKKAPISPELDENLLEHLRNLVAGAEPSFKTVTISNGSSRVRLDKSFEANLQTLLNEEDASYGHVEGSLDTINIHGHARRFWIYPRVGAQKIRCDFLPGSSEQLRDALGQYVRVEGVKYFRAQSPYPFRVSVREFTVLPDKPEVHLKDLRGIATEKSNALSSVEFVRNIRDEWD
jgi:hypothetical protein